VGTKCLAVSLELEPHAARCHREEMLLVDRVERPTDDLSGAFDDSAGRCQLRRDIRFHCDLLDMCPVRRVWNSNAVFHLRTLQFAMSDDSRSPPARSLPQPELDIDRRLRHCTRRAYSFRIAPPLADRGGQASGVDDAQLRQH
jgi:hypothetical protein